MTFNPEVTLPLRVLCLKNTIKYFTTHRFKSLYTNRHFDKNKQASTYIVLRNGWRARALMQYKRKKGTLDVIKLSSVVLEG